MLVADPVKKDYFTLTLDYNGRQYRFQAHLYYYRNYVESWYVRGKDDILTFDYDTREKTLRQTFVYNRREVPADFLAALQEQFLSR